MPAEDEPIPTMEAAEHDGGGIPQEGPVSGGSGAGSFTAGELAAGSSASSTTPPEHYGAADYAAGTGTASPYSDGPIEYPGAAYEAKGEGAAGEVTPKDGGH